MRAYVFPGQGSQRKKMGASLFSKYQPLITIADEILGYSVEDLCRNNPDQKLNETQFTQPALFIVNALTYLDQVETDGLQPQFVAGHSLGEYNALFAAGAFDFETGVKLVKQRGQIMAQAKEGGMAAIIGGDGDEVASLLAKHGIEGVDIANINSPSQIVISGIKEEVTGSKEVFEEAGLRFTPLRVSAAFHSRYMLPAAEEFKAFLETFQFLPLKIPVISNLEARPYEDDRVRDILAGQIAGTVKWLETVRYLMGRQITDFQEIGPGKVLTKLVGIIQKECEPLVLEEDADKSELKSPQTELQDEVQQDAVEVVEAVAETKETSAETPTIVTDSHSQDPVKDVDIEEPAARLGSQSFRQRYNLKYAYLAGGMGNGISSESMVVKMGRHGLMSFFGTGNLSLAEIEQTVSSIRGQLCNGEPFGVNLAGKMDNGEWEQQVVNILLQNQVRNLEISNFFQVTDALVHYRLKGAFANSDGRVVLPNRLLVKTSRPEIAERFLKPAARDQLDSLVAEGRLTSSEADLGKNIPLAQDLCALGDCGWATERSSLAALLPTFSRMRDEAIAAYPSCHEPIHIGAGGGIGTPEAAASALILGADFILTGSINQCTVEAQTSDLVKSLLQQANVQDTEYAPDENYFETGGVVQVLKKGVFFPMRATKLRDIYRRCQNLQEVDEHTAKQIQDGYFHQSFDEVFSEIATHVSAEVLAKAEQNAKSKMSLIFKWYLDRSNRDAIKGKQENKVNFQVYCSPALGAFNQWVKGSNLESWANRHVDVIAKKLMLNTAEFLHTRCRTILSES